MNIIKFKPARLFGVFLWFDEPAEIKPIKQKSNVKNGSPLIYTISEQDYSEASFIWDENTGKIVKAEKTLLEKHLANRGIMNKRQLSIVLKEFGITHKEIRAIQRM